MIVFENLSTHDKGLLLKAPVYVSLLASHAHLEEDRDRKSDAIEMVHIRTFSSPANLHAFYAEAEKVFLENLKEINCALPKGLDERLQRIQQELKKLNPVFHQLGEAYASELHKSLESYAKHVSKATGNVFVSAMIPLYLKVFGTEHPL
jgi:hypothetical protein